MSKRSRIFVWSAALVMLVAASVLHASAPRLFIPGGTTEIPVGDRVLVIQASDDFGLLLNLDGDVLIGHLEKAYSNQPAVHVTIKWSLSELTVFSGEVDAPVDFTTSLEKETGHGEM